MHHPISKKGFLTALLLFMLSPAWAFFVFDPLCLEAYNDIVCLRLDKAAALLQKEKTASPANQVPYLLDHYIDFLKVIISEEDRDLAHLKDNSDPRLQKLAAAGSSSPWYLYSQAMVHMQTGFARIKFSEYVNAGLDISTAYRLLTSNQEKFPSFAPNKTLLGLLHTLIGTIPPKFRWAARTLNFKGTIAQGNQEIEEAYKSISTDPQLAFLLPETAFIHSFVGLNLTADQAAALAFAEKMNSPPLSAYLQQSPMMAYALANVYNKTGNNSKVVTLLSNLHYTPDQHRFHFLNYLLGVAKMNRLDKDAIYPLLDFVGSFRGKNYLKSAYLYIAWYYALNGNPAQYDVYMKRIGQRGNSQVDNDRDAIMVAAKNKKPVTPLIKARLLCDGGYYQQALDELTGFEPADQLAELEYTYRKGRIYDRWGRPEMALPLYAVTIQKGENLPHYFAANAALQTALIYEKQGKYSLARTFYEKVLNMNFEEYQFSISNKAQAGLNRMKSKTAKTN